MITTITLIAGLLLLTLQIVFYEIHQQIDRIKTEIEPLTKDGGMYPKAKPIELADLTRKLSTKSAPLYHVIQR
jgi:hypothetical protein